MLTVDEGTKVTLHFALMTEQGEPLDSTFDRSSAQFVFGDDSLPLGVQSCLRGMRPGDRQRFRLLPEQAFGQPNPNNIQQFSRSQFGAQFELQAGLVMGFQDAAKGEVPGVIRAFDDQQVEVDFNHPLAGQTLWFEAEILAVEAQL